MVSLVLEVFMKKNCKKLVKKNLKKKKGLKDKVIKYTSKGKSMIIHLIVGLIKKILNYFLKKLDSLITNESMLS